nr:MAG TPA: hypothetical protein [Caudoviricetes sp.]
MDASNERKRIEGADAAERLARLERIADMLDRGEISLPRDDKGNEVNGFYADDMERVADFADDMRGRIHYRELEPTQSGVVAKLPTYHMQQRDKITKELKRRDGAYEFDEVIPLKEESDGQTKKITSFVKLTPDARYLNGMEHVTRFDLIVANAIVSLYAAGNEYMTYPMIYRAIIGRVGEEIKPSKVWRGRIDQAVTRLMGTVLEADCTDVYDTYYAKNPGKHDRRKYSWRGNLLYAEIVTEYINGNMCKNVVHVLSIKGYEYAADRRHISTRPTAINAIPLRYDVPTLELADYLRDRIESMGGRNPMSKTINLETLLTDLHIVDMNRPTESDRKKAARTLNKVKKILDYWAGKTIGANDAKLEPPYIAGWRPSKKGDSRIAVNGVKGIEIVRGRPELTA